MLRQTNNVGSSGLSASLLAALGLACWSSWSMGVSIAQETAQPNRIGHRIRISLPINDLVSREVRQALQRFAEQAPGAVRADQRPVIVLEFDTSSGNTGRGSELEACQSLARALTDAQMNRVETVAFIPRPDGDAPSGLNDPTAAGLSGHAVLVAIAANQLALEPGTSLGSAGIDEPTIDQLISTVYQTVAERRLRLPVPLVMGMLDASRGVYRVTMDDQSVVYLDEAAWQQLAASGKSYRAVTLSAPGSFARMTAEQLGEYRLISRLPTSRRELSASLNLNPDSLEVDPSAGRDWKALEIPLPFSVDEKTQRWIISKLSQQLAEGVNLVIFTIDESEGDLQACLGVAQRIADCRQQKVRTVAFVREKASGPIGLIALSCDHLIMAPNATLGGRDTAQLADLTPAAVEEVRPTIKSIAALCDRDWSLMVAMLNPGLTITRYRDRNSGQVRLLSNEELNSIGDLERWMPLGPVSMADGINATTAEQLSVARLVASDMDQLQAFYQLPEAPPALILTSSERWLEKFASVLTHPLVTIMLIWGVFFFISTELSAPGLGVPGFLGVICLVLFFWANWLDGNAEWFEILMFVFGLLFLLLELFVIPGFGIFGIGGLLLLLTSLVLATQKFVLPTTNEELAQLPYSLLPIVGAGLGVVAAAVVLRKAIPNSPYLNRMLIQKRSRDETGLDDDRDPEAVVDWSYLANRTGETLTRLNPAGKARIGGRVYDVISTGVMLDKGEPIVVVEAIGNRIVVQSRSADAS